MPRKSKSTARYLGGDVIRSPWVLAPDGDRRVADRRQAGDDEDQREEPETGSAPHGDPRAEADEPDERLDDRVHRLAHGATLPARVGCRAMDLAMIGGTGAEGFGLALRL